MFSNPFYCGQFVYCGELSDGAHEPMVTPAEFDRAQELLGRYGRPRPKKHRFAFRGLIRCGQCGASVTAEEEFKAIRSTGERRRYVYYHCTHRKDPSCRQGSIEEAELKRQVDSFLASITIPREYLDWVFKYLDVIAKGEQGKTESAEQSRRKELERVNKRLQNLFALKIAPDNTDGHLISDSEFVDQKNRLLKEKSRLESVLREDGDASAQVDTLTHETFKFSAYARAWFANGDEDRQRTILAAVSSNHELADGFLRISAEKPLEIIQRRRPRLPAVPPKFEPPDGGQPQRKTGNGMASSGVWCTLVNDVRTAIGDLLRENEVGGFIWCVQYGVSPTPGKTPRHSASIGSTQTSARLLQRDLSA